MIALVLCMSVCSKDDDNNTLAPISTERFSEQSIFTAKAIKSLTWRSEWLSMKLLATKLTATLPTKVVATHYISPPRAKYSTSSISSARVKSSNPTNMWR